MGGDYPDEGSVGKPFIIENVVGAPLIDRGSMFGLMTYRHRCQFDIVPPGLLRWGGG